MFDIGWPELFVVAAVALVAIGPKDLPKAMHAVGRWAGKMRTMAQNWQGAIDRIAYEAEIAEKLEKEGDQTGKQPGNETQPSTK